MGDDWHWHLGEHLVCAGMMIWMGAGQALQWHARHASGAMVEERFVALGSWSEGILGGKPADVDEVGVAAMWTDR